MQSIFILKTRKRLTYFLLIAVTIPLGLSTRKFGYAYPQIISEYGGDILYATFIFFLVRFIAVKWSLLKIELCTYMFCICIEIFQLYKAPWIETIRHTFPFGLILGYGFLWSDWICYAIGTAIAFIISYALEREIKPETQIGS